MKYHSTNIIGDAGEHLVASRVINYFGFPCRLNNIDIGIDAEIEIIDDSNHSTGQFIKCQIKTTTVEKYSIYIDKIHIEYWNKLKIPVIIFLVHIKTEKIYWHIIDKIEKYGGKNKQFKIEFDKSNSLKKSNKNKFIQISNYQFEKKIEDIILQSLEKVKEDNQMIKSDNYDLTTFEQFVYHSNKINYDLNKIEKITRKENSLKDFEIKFATELKEINEYLEWVEEHKEHILLDNGFDYYDYLKAENYDWE